MGRKAEHTVQKRGLFRREAILRIAADEFAHKGFNGARIEVIARRAKVNQAMLYYHYGSKAMLFQQAIQKIADAQFKNAWPEFPSNWNMSYAEKLYLIMYYFAQYQLTVVDHRFSRLIAWDLAENNRILKRVMQTYIVPIIHQFAELLQAGVKAGEFEITQPYMFVHGFFSTLSWYKLSRETLEDTVIFTELYDQDEENVDKFATFLVENSLKCLSPSGKLLRPIIVPEHIEYVRGMLATKASQTLFEPAPSAQRARSEKGD